jgi:hypothetical protein
MTSFARLHLPRLGVGTRTCLCVKSGSSLYCSRAAGHTGRHVATMRPTRYVIAVWEAS